MANTKDGNELNASNLKDELWKTLNDLRQGKNVHRRRVCPTCKHRFSTDEIVVQEGAAGNGRNTKYRKDMK